MDNFIPINSSIVTLPGLLGVAPDNISSIYTPSFRKEEIDIRISRFFHERFREFFSRDFFTNNFREINFDKIFHD